MDAIIFAGGKAHPDDPLYEAAGGGPKALIDVCGKPMVQWVIDAINGSAQIDQVAIVGLAEDIPLECAHPTVHLPDQGSLLDNIRVGAEALNRLHPEEKYTLVVTGDLPALRTEMIDWLVERVREHRADLYYNVIRREVMEQRFPDSRRTYLRLKDGEYCGGDANAVRKEAAMCPSQLAREIVNARKNPVKQASLVGLDVLGLVLLRQLTVLEAARRVSNRLGFQGIAIETPYAEIGMDVDKPFQLEILRADLSRRAAV